MSTVYLMSTVYSNFHSTVAPLRAYTIGAS